MLLTGAIVEQTFTIATTQLHTNMSASTVQDVMYHAVSLKTPAIHIVVHTSSSSGTQQPRRANRSAESRAQVSMQFKIIAEKHENIRKYQGSKRKCDVMENASRVSLMRTNGRNSTCSTPVIFRKQTVDMQRLKLARVLNCQEKSLNLMWLNPKIVAGQRPLSFNTCVNTATTLFMNQHECDQKMMTKLATNVCKTAVGTLAGKSVHC